MHGRGRFWLLPFLVPIHRRSVETTSRFFVQKTSVKKQVVTDQKVAIFMVRQLALVSVLRARINCPNKRPILFQLFAVFELLAQNLGVNPVVRHFFAASEFPCSSCEGLHAGSSRRWAHAGMARRVASGPKAPMSYSRAVPVSRSQSDEEQELMGVCAVNLVWRYGPSD